jgi:hypothetical protein
MSHTKTVLVSKDAGATSTSVTGDLLVAFVNDTATASSSLAAFAAGTKYQYQTGKADNDAAAVDQLVTAINASKRDVFKDVVAAEKSGATTVIQITMPLNVNMRGAANDNSSAVTNATPAVFTIGTVADVNADFEDGLPIQGVTNIAGPNVVKPAAPASGSETYDRSCIYVRTDDVAHGRIDMHEIVIYSLASNTTLNGHLDTHLG